MKKFLLPLLLPFIFFTQVYGQVENTLSLDLEKALSLAFENQPLIQLYQNEVEKANQEIKSNKSQWLPQLGLNGELNRYFQQPVAIFPDFDNPESGEFQEVRTGVPHNANLNFTVNQSFLNNDLFRASAQNPSLRNLSIQNLEEFKIQLVVDLSKAFYEVLLAEEQVRLTEEDLNRQSKQLADAKLQFEAGITDNIDYKRATITLQNTQGQLFQFKEQVKVRRSALKYWLGLEDATPIQLNVEAESLEQDLEIDTMMTYSPDQRIEYQLLNTEKRLLDAELSFQKRRYLPDLSAFYNYNFLFLSPVGNQLFDQVYSFSLVGLRLNLPIFMGGQRRFETRMAALDLRNVELEQENLSLQVSREQQEALSLFKANLYLLKTQKSNQILAEEIYETIALQYEQGIKNFLEVIQAETDLRTSRINYLRSLFAALNAKIDLQRSRGEIKTDY